MTAREFLREEGIETVRGDIRNVIHIAELMEKYVGTKAHDISAGALKAMEYNEELDRNIEARRFIENWFPEGNGTVDAVTVNLNDDIRATLPDPQNEDDDYSQVVSLAGAPFSYIATTTKQLELMDALTKAVKSDVPAEIIIQYLNRLPV